MRALDRSAADVDAALLRRASASLAAASIGHDDQPWETLDEVRTRVHGVLKKYLHLDTIVVVTHAVVIGSVVGAQRLIDHAEIVPYEFDPAHAEPVQDPGVFNGR